MELDELIAAEMAQPVDPRVSAAAAAIAGRHPGARAVIFYGSCLRTGEVDGQMLDFYLIVRDYREAYGKAWLAWANRLVPPNVFPFEERGVAAKYAVLSKGDLDRLTRREANNVSVWARFAQPIRLVWSADRDAEAAVRASVRQAMMTLVDLTMPMLAGGVDHSLPDVWRRGFELTYQAELRAERSGRAASIVDLEPDRYERAQLATGAAVALRDGVGRNGEVPFFLSHEAAQRRWRRLRRNGKALTVLRLAKASLTFAGGIDYLAWKINRHAGTRIEIKPWQRRWPLLGAVTLLPRLLRAGAIR